MCSSSQLGLSPPPCQEPPHLLRPPVPCLLRAEPRPAPEHRPEPLVGDPQLLGRTFPRHPPPAELEGTNNLEPLHQLPWRRPWAGDGRAPEVSQPGLRQIRRLGEACHGPRWAGIRKRPEERKTKLRRQALRSLHEARKPTLNGRLRRPSHGRRQLALRLLQPHQYRPAGEFLSPARVRTSSVGQDDPGGPQVPVQEEAGVIRQPSVEGVRRKKDPAGASAGHPIHLFQAEYCHRLEPAQVPDDLGGLLWILCVDHDHGTPHGPWGIALGGEQEYCERGGRGDNRADWTISFMHN